MITRSPFVLRADPRRVIAKPYFPGEEIAGGHPTRASLLMARILALSEEEVTRALDEVLVSFQARHRHFEELLDRHWALVAPYAGDEPVSVARRRLVGAYFTHEYSVEGAALFNPSVVPSPDQTGLAEGQCRFVMSLRAVGEGHISSIEFRSGTFDLQGTVLLEAASPFLVAGLRAPPSTYAKALFRAKLVELGVGNEVAWQILERLPMAFSLAELDASLLATEQETSSLAMTYETVKIVRVLAASSYVTTFPTDSTLSERVIFPAGPNETHGMEDARFVRFQEDDGAVRYYATYTAFDGYGIVPQLIETEDFRQFQISTLHGSAAQNKGMALFPRRIGGKYVMISRRDRENLHLAQSDRLDQWDTLTELHRPRHPWELVQIGNCGSPIETDAGWLLLTHGVGPMRRYAIGALLLDRDDPLKVIGELREPLLAPEGPEREGYVPNVVYSCGAMKHGDHLMMPYGLSDGAVGISVIRLASLHALLRPPAAA